MMEIVQGKAYETVHKILLGPPISSL